MATSCDLLLKIHNKTRCSLKCQPVLPLARRGLGGVVNRTLRGEWVGLERGVSFVRLLLTPSSKPNKTRLMTRQGVV